MTKNKLISFLKNENGATAIEYAMIASLVSAFIVLSVRSVGSNMNSVFYEGLVNMF